VRGFLRKFYYAISGDAPDGTWPNDKASDASLLEGLVDPQPFPAWLTPADLDYYVAEFEQSGLRGPINRYRNHQADFAWLQGFAGRRIEQPSLFIGGERDLVLAMLRGVDFLEVMRGLMPGFRGGHLLAGCGHWTQQERPAEVNALLIPWLKSL
jgi:pimeloyl-ACP methyl ester carboxylesterase